MDLNSFLARRLGARRAASVSAPAEIADSYDVVVVGGGVRALAIARRCAVAGARVGLFAPGEIAGAADERAFPVIRAAHSDPLEAAARRDAPKRLRKLARRAPNAVPVDRAGCLTLAPSPELAEALAEAGRRAKAAGTEAWMVPAREVAALSSPLGSNAGLGPALFEPGALTTDADAAALALAESASGYGAALFSGTPVAALERDGAAISGVRLADGLVTAGAVVLADDLAAIRLVREGKGRLSLKRDERLILKTIPGAPAIGPAIVAGKVTLARDLSGAITASGPVADDALATSIVALAPALAGVAVASEEPVTVWAGIDGRAQIGAAEFSGLWLALGFGRDALSAALPAAKQIAALIAGKRADPAFEPFAPTRKPLARGVSR